ncbi:MAG TPA: glutathione S-transferase family protein [Steroidobacteraceae bacterium]
MAGTPYRLLGRPNAGSLAPQMLLEEVGAAYELIWIGREPESLEGLRRINPAGKVPVLILPDGVAVFESAAILIHLTDAHPDAGLAPRAGTTAHAHFLQWMTFLSSSVYEAALRAFYPERYSRNAAREVEGIKAQALHDYAAHLELIHQALSPYVLGEHLSAADPYLLMLQSWYPGDAAALTKRLPKLSQHAELLRRRPAVRKAEQDHAG